MGHSVFPKHMPRKNTEKGVYATAAEKHTILQRFMLKSLNHEM